MEVCSNCLGEFEYPLDGQYCYGCASGLVEEFEEEQGSVSVNEYVKHMNAVIPDDAICVGVLIKCEVKDEEPENFLDEIGFITIRDFLLNTYKCRIIGATCGIHLQGRSQKRHIHYNLIMTNFKPPTNNSKNKKIYMTAEGLDDFCECGYKVSFKFEKIKLDAPKYQHLTYPLKEGLEVDRPLVNIWQGVKMKKEMLDFLKSVGQAIFEKEKALNERRDKHDAKIKNQLYDLYLYAKEKKYNSYPEFVKDVDDVYLRKIPFGERPNSRNLVEHIRQVAYELGLASMI